MIMEKSKKFLIFIITLILVAGIILAAYFLSGWMFTSIGIDGQSMYPTIHNGDVAILYKQGDYERGDIVVFNTHKRDAYGNERYFVKRIIALEGDTVKIDPAPGATEDDPVYGIYVNGEFLREDYLADNVIRASAADKPDVEITVQPRQFFRFQDRRRTRQRGLRAYRRYPGQGGRDVSPGRRRFKDRIRKTRRMRARGKVFRRRRTCSAVRKSLCGALRTDASAGSGNGK